MTPVQPVTTDRLIGEVLADRYQILERLGEGAMGTVYKARHIKVGRWFAVKVLHARLLVDDKTTQRFEREAELAGRLRHANVVGVVDVGEIDGRHYMVMDFAEGPDLGELLAEAPMRPDRIINLIRQILEGLYHAHEQGLIHRDLKPENVIVERDTHGAEMPRIVDFGIAILRDIGGDSGQGRLTTNGLVLGTPHYMAPEQAVADPIDHRIDLFALGIVMYEMLSGQLPFDGSGAEVARANLLLDPPAIAERVPYLEADPLLEAFARRLMAKKPAQRPATAKAARELLDLIERDRHAAAVALGVPTSAHTPALTQPVSPHQVEAGGWPSPAEVPTVALPTPSQAPTEPPTMAMPTRPLKATPSPPPLFIAAPAVGPPPPPQPLVRLPRAPVASRDTDPTRTPPAARNRFLVPALLLAAAGVFAAVVLMRSSGNVATVTAPSHREAAAAVASPTPAAVAPAVAPAAAATAGAIDPPPPTTTGTIDPPPAPPATAELAKPRPSATKPASKRAHPGEQVAHAPRAKAAPAGEVKAVDPKATATRPTDPRSGDAIATTPPAARPVASPSAMAIAPPTAGVTPSALSSMYYAVPKALDQLPPDQSQDLRDRFRNFNVQALMLGPQAARDTAAMQLYQILHEAKLRKPANAAPQPRTEPDHRRRSSRPTVR